MLVSTHVLNTSKVGITFEVFVIFVSFCSFLVPTDPLVRFWTHGNCSRTEGNEADIQALRYLCFLLFNLLVLTDPLVRF